MTEARPGNKIQAVPRAALRALLPFALLVPARGLDRALGMLLHTGLDLPSIFFPALALWNPPSLLGGSLVAVVCGAAFWMTLASERSRREHQSFEEALRAEAATFSPLLLVPLVSLLELLSLALRPAFPYASTLSIALAQDFHPLLLIVIAAAILALRSPSFSLPSPRAGEVFFIAFVFYALLSPDWAATWEGHPGNEPKTLRTAVALGARLSLNVEPETSVEEGADVLSVIPPEPLLPAAREALETMIVESYGMITALPLGREAFGAQAIRAERVARQTVSGKDGGIYHVLAPGPSLLLAPFVRADQELDARRRTPGRLAITLLFWNAVAAGLLTSLFLLLRDVTGRAGIAALVTFAGGFAPPFLFFFYQFYPETLGAWAFVVMTRRLLRPDPFKVPESLFYGLLLGSLPFLHQKFLPCWGVLVLIFVYRLVSDLAPLEALVALLAPQVLSFYFTALFNFAITGSARPDALFLAWGPGGVNTARIGEGLLGLLFDFRYGILPVIPVYALAFAGILRRQFALVSVPYLVYYATVAAADNWSGSVANLGRYIVPVIPLLLVGIALVLASPLRRGVLFVCLALSGLSALGSLALWRDGAASVDTAVLFDKSAFADVNLYVPNLFFRTWNYAQPGQGIRLAVSIGLVALLTLWLRRALLGGGGGRSVPRALWGSLALALCLSLFLERWPSSRTSPLFQNAVRVGRDAKAYLTGASSVKDGRVRVRSGCLGIFISSGQPLDTLQVVAQGAGRLGDWSVPRAGGELTLTLKTLGEVSDRKGRHETLSAASLEIRTPSELLLMLHGEPR